MLPIFRDAPVAILITQPDTGALKGTPSSRTSENHHTFWVALDVSIQDLVVGEL